MHNLSKIFHPEYLFSSKVPLYTAKSNSDYEQKLVSLIKNKKLVILFYMSAMTLAKRQKSSMQIDTKVFLLLIIKVVE